MPVKANSFLVEVSGPFALFTRPEFKAERVSYDCITPSAARGILDSLYFHPGMKWVIDRIYICNPIVLTSIRRNEVKDVISARGVKSWIENPHGSLSLDTSLCRTQRASLLLKDVKYVIEAHPEMTNLDMPRLTIDKICEIMKRRLEKGQCFYQPYLGCREYVAFFQPYTNVELPACPRSLLGEHDLGFMLLDMDYSNPEDIQPKFFRAKCNNGVIDVPSITDEEVHG